MHRYSTLAQKMGGGVKELEKLTKYGCGRCSLYSVEHCRRPIVLNLRGMNSIEHFKNSIKMNFCISNYTEVY